VYAGNGTTVLRWQQFSYDSVGRTTHEKTLDPASGRVQQQVDRVYYTSGNGNGPLQKVIQHDLSNPANDVTTTYFYDPAGRVSRTNQNLTFGNCTAAFTLYDPAGSVLASVCNYDNGSSPTDPTTLAGVLALYNAAFPDKNKITTYTYDALGRRVSTTTQAGSAFAVTNLTVYDSLNRVVRSIANYVPDAALPDPSVHARSDFKHGANNDQNLLTETRYNERGLIQSQTVAGCQTVLSTELPFNVALGKTVSQSSNLTGQPLSYTQASNAVDGNTDGIYGDQSISHTNADANAWWQVDLGAVYDLSNINVWNRTDGYQSRLSNYYLCVSEVPFASTDLPTTLNQPGVSSFYFSDSAGWPTPQAIGRTGRYVRVQLNKTEYLSLAEVQVYGVPPVTAGPGTQPCDSVTLFGYDAADRLVKTVQSASQPHYDNAYGPNGDPGLANYIPSSAPDVDILTLNQYDATGNLVQTTDVLGNVTLTGYDALNRPVRVIRNASQPTYNLTADPGLSHYTSRPHLALGSTYKARILQDAPYAYYRMDAGSGTLEADRSGHNLPGVYAGTVGAWMPGALTGDSDPASAFNGTNTRVALPAPPLQNASFSFELWLYCTASISDRT
jgi:YD repeat-containing protein